MKKIIYLFVFVLCIICGSSCTTYDHVFMSTTNTTTNTSNNFHYENHNLRNDVRKSSNYAPHTNTNYTVY